MLADDLVDHRLELRLFRLEDDVRVIFSNHRHIRRNDDHVQTVNVAELAFLGLGRSGHSGEVVEQAEQILERDRGERLVLAPYLDAFFGFDRLVDAVGVAPAVHQTAGKLVDDDHFAFFNDVLLIEMKEIPRFECRVELMRQLDIALIVEILNAQHLLDLGDARFHDRDGVRFLVDGVVLALFQARDDLRELFVQFARLLRRTADDQRRPSLVDQNRIDFVDQCEVQFALHEVLDLPGHVVAKVVEADLVVRDVGHVAVVSGASLGGVETVLNDSDAQAEELVKRPHPLGIAPGQVVVDGHHRHASSLEGARVHGQRRDERLAFAGLHLGDAAFVKHLAAHDLHVEVAHAERAFSGLTNDCKDLGQ